jgi:Protein of unknown function (DUF3795)
MEPMIACCGLVCTDCPTYLATQADDDAAREKTAKEWSKLYGAEIKPEQINCDGCQSEGGRLFGHCLECKIRSCAHDRGFVTCAECPDYSCEQLEQVLQYVPDARAKLEAMRA